MMIKPAGSRRREEARWRNVYRTPEGRYVLARQLYDSGLLRRIKTEEQRVGHNLAIALLEKLGALSFENHERLVDFIIGLPLSSERAQTKEHGTT